MRQTPRSARIQKQMSGSRLNTNHRPSGEHHSHRWIEPLATPKAYPAGSELLRQGSVAEYVYLIDRGLVKLIHSERYSENTTVGLRYPGCALGAAAALLGKPQPVTAATLTVCYLRRLEAAELRRLINVDTTCSWQLHLVQSHELDGYTTELTELRALSARRRLERLLLKLLDAYQRSGSRKKTRLKLPLKHREIAELVAVTPEDLSQMLEQMQDEGIIDQVKGGIVIDPVKLGDFLGRAPTTQSGSRGTSSRWNRGFLPEVL